MTVSVILVTYNHESYIARAIESVLSQANVDWELLISEDCSRDLTREIVARYQRAHPNRIRVLLSPHNLGTNEVFTRAVAVARGEFIATLDGDDYWISPDKLRRQVEFMTEHPECSMCFHNVLKFWEGKALTPAPFHEQPLPPLLSFSEILLRNDVASCSAMLRRRLITNLPAWYDSAPLGDWPLYIVSAQHGDIGYIDRIMGAYRIHDRGAWSGSSELDQLLLRSNFYRVLRLDGERAHSEIPHALSRVGEDLTQLVARQTDHRQWTNAIRSAVALARHFPGQALREVRTTLSPHSQPRRLRRYPRLYRAFRDVRGRLKRQPAEPAFEGVVEHIDRRFAGGWVWDCANPDAILSIDIRDQHQLLATVSADRFRGDLIAAGKGDGYHGFACELPVPAGLSSARPRVYVAGTDWELTSPALATVPPPESIQARPVRHERPQRVLFAYRFLGAGGVETALINRSEALRKEGIESTVLFGQSYGSGGAALANRPNVHVGLDPGALFDLLSQPYDVVSIVDYPDLLPLATLARPDALFFAETHTPLAQWLRDFCRSTGVPAVRGVLVPSQFNAERVRRVCTAGKSIDVIPNAIDQTHFAPARVEVLGARFGPLLERTVILFVGRLEEAKNPDGFLEAASLLSTRHRALHFILVGDAPGNEPYRTRLQNRIPRDRKNEYTFVRDVPYDDMPLYYSLAGYTGGCLLSTARFESVPMTFIEAMACDCPVVAAQVGGIAEIVKHEETGVLFEVENGPAAVAAVEAIIAPSARAGHRQRVISAARRYVHEVHSHVATAQRFLDVVTRVPATEVAHR